MLTFLELYLRKNLIIKPKCCMGTETFGIGLYSRGMSCSDMINCCPFNTFCSNGACISNNKKKGEE